MARQIETTGFIVRFDDLGNDMYSMVFSVDGSDYENILPKCIYEKPNDPGCNYDSFRRVNGWSSFKYEREQQNSFCLFGVNLNVEDKVCRFNIVTWNDRIIHTRLLHTYWSSESLKIEKYSDSVVIITDFSESKVFVDFSGNILLKTDGIPGWTYEKLLGYYGSQRKEMPYDLVKSPYFVLARINNQWTFFGNNLKKIKILEWLFDYKIEGKCSGEYVLLHLFRTTYEVSGRKTLVLYKDGSLIFSRENDFLNIQKYEEGTGISYATDNQHMYFNTGNIDLPIFKKNKYLFTIRGKSCFNLFSDTDNLAVFFNETEPNHRFGIINRKLDIVVPQILEYASIVKGSIIKYKLNGKVGLWNESLSSIAPPKYQSIEAVESFFIAAMQGGFPNSFWYKWLNTFDGDGYSFSNAKDDPEECIILKKDGEQSWPETFKNVYCKFHHHVYNGVISYDDPMALCIIEKNSRIKYGIISSDGDFVIPPIYDYLEVATDTEGKYYHKPKAFIFAENAITEPAISPKGNNKYVINGGNYGLLSLDGSTVIPALYDAVTVYGDFVRVRKNDKYGLYSIDGRVLLDTMFSAINFMEIDGRTAMAVYNINGIVKGELSDLDKYYSFGLPDFPIYGPRRSFYSYNNNKIIIEGGMWGYYNLSQQLRGEALYTEVHPFDKGYAIVKYNNFYYLINHNLKICSEAHESLCYGKYRSENFHQDEDYYDESDYGYSPEELEQMYRDAFEGDPDAQWNID